MADETLKFPKGTALLFTAGCYSDFGTCGAIVTIKDCDLSALGAQYRSECEDRAEDEWARGPESTDFADWLVAQGHAMPADIEEVHLDDGYDFDIDRR